MEIANPNLGAIRAGFLEEEVSILRSVGQEGINQEKGEGEKKGSQATEPALCCGPGETVAYNLLIVQWLHQISAEWSFPASSPLSATVPDFLNIDSLTHISVNESIRFIKYLLHEKLQTEC